MGLDGILAKPYGSLSGGQKRRVNIALALVGDPEILFLDEPTAGLDPEYRFRFWDYLRRQNGRGMTIVATTHYLEEAREYCDAVLLINEGRVVTSGPPEHLIAESGLAARVVLPRAALGTVGADSLMGLPGVAQVRSTETAFYLYGVWQRCGQRRRLPERERGCTWRNRGAARQPGRHLLSCPRE